MNIPEQFWLAGMPIKVEYSSLHEECKPTLEELYCDGRLLLNINSSNPFRREQEYLREVIRYILYTVAADNILEDNQFVTIFSRFLHQALLSSDQNVQQKGDQDEIWKNFIEFPSQQDMEDIHDASYLETLEAEMALRFGLSEAEVDCYLEQMSWGEERPNSSDANDEDEYLSQREWEEDSEDYDDPDTDSYYSWVEDADCWERSNDEGWYYDDFD